MTTKLYLDDPYLRRFTSAVSHIIDIEDRPGIVLEKTLFYPSSGGQPHDTGTINDIPVIDVFEDESRRVVHILAEPVAGNRVEGRIDWQRRFDHMQQHTGQHLLSQAFVRAANAQTRSFHLGDQSSTLDVDQAGFSLTTIEAVEDLANRIIYENRPVMVHLVGKNELDQYPVRKPPAVEDKIRIVEIKDFDYSPCGGTHCSNAGEIGIVKIRRFENYKGGTRIHFLCGRRALKDYQEKSNIIRQIGEFLSAGEADLYNNIRKNRDELKALRRENSNLNKRYLHYEALALFSERKKIDAVNIIVKIFEDRHPRELKILAQKVMEDFPDSVVLFGARSDAKASLFFLRSGAVACDMGKLMQDACAVINGRGGGRPQQAQGGGPAAQNLETALQGAYLNIARMLTSNG
jgi:alanyl-tRNA synthetase